MMGHSVSTLKLNILFGKGFDGDSGNSAAAGELGLGDVANKFNPGCQKKLIYQIQSL